MKWLYRILLMAVALLSYTSVMAFESPSGYMPAVYTIDLTFTEPIVVTCATPESVADKVTENLTILESCKACYKSYTAGGYITYKPLPVAQLTAKLERGYTKVLFS